MILLTVSREQVNVNLVRTITQKGKSERARKLRDGVSGSRSAQSWLLFVGVAAYTKPPSYIKPFKPFKTTFTTQC